MSARLSNWQLLFSLILIWSLVQVGVGLCHLKKPLPYGISLAGHPQAVTEIRFLKDITYLDAEGQRQSRQEIFDAVLTMVDRAKSFIVVDMFLYNSFLGAEQVATRPLSSELTARLLEKKREAPEIEITLITDPLNTLYGGIELEHLRQLREGGVRVVLTHLEPLRDSNPLYSSAWRMVGQWLGNAATGMAPNPFGKGRASWRGYVHLLNFKANHRKMIAADDELGLIGLVTSANPHDGSSAHENIAVQFRGAAVADLVRAANGVLRISGEERLSVPQSEESETLFLETEEPTLTVVTERKIKENLIHALETTEAGDSVDVVMFYFSDRDLLTALLLAKGRGVDVRVMLDPNRDAFGRKKSGLPNRPLAYELNRADISVRWRETHGEQCHSKLLLIRYRDGRSLACAGSGNWTRRNLDNFNLELNVVAQGPAAHSFFAEIEAYLEMLWANQEDRLFTVPYSQYSDASPLRSLQYRALEATGVCTF